MKKQNTTKRIRLSLQEKTVEDLEILGNMKNVLVDTLLTELFSKMDSLTIYKWLILKQRKKENLQEALNKLFTIIFSSSFT
ncbi:MAG TPA: hypothetical protein ENO30_05620, partial [Thermodesulfobium narugense]|nr:hypothetical protein [Thermodesulfobium narugense]